MFFSLLSWINPHRQHWELENCGTSEHGEKLKQNLELVTRIMLGYIDIFTFKTKFCKISDFFDHSKNKQQPTNTVFLNRIFLEPSLPNGSTNYAKCPEAKESHIFPIILSWFKSNKQKHFSWSANWKIPNGVGVMFFLKICPGATTHITRVIRIIFSRSVLGKSLSRIFLHKNIPKYYLHMEL